MFDACPLFPQKQTLVERVVMSALCQKRTSDTYSITSSARTRNDSGIFRAVTSAVFRFTINSYLTDDCTGRSAGFAPRRILSM